MFRRYVNKANVMKALNEQLVFGKPAIDVLCTCYVCGFVCVTCIFCVVYIIWFMCVLCAMFVYVVTMYFACVVWSLSMCVGYVCVVCICMLCV